MENEELVGKSIGGDIIENKKTALFHLSLLNANKQQANDLIALFNNSSLKIKLLILQRFLKKLKLILKH